MATTPRNGVLVAAALLVVGAAAAGVAWWNTLSQTRRALVYWGPEAAVLVRDAPQVAAMVIDFEEPSDESGSATFEGGLVHPATGAPAHIREARDISGARGLVHLRHALLDDRSFDWAAAAREPGDLGYALTFEQEDRRLIVYLSRDFKHLTAAGPFHAIDRTAGEAGLKSTESVGRTRETVSAEPLAEGLQRYFADVLSAGAIKTKDER